MSDRERYHLLLTPDLERLMAEKEVDLNELIRRAAPEVKMEIGQNIAGETEGEKELVTILLASAAVIAALTPTLKELIRAATDRPIVATDMIPVPLLDNTGKPILGSNGEPAVAWAQTMRDL